MSSRRQAPRASRQARGQARIETILDAAASMIAEGGIASATMHQVAKRAQTSIGSMYHFFPDKESLLQTLVERHAAAVRRINEQLSTVPADVWRNKSAAAAINYLVTPYIEYTKQHPDFFAVMHGRSTAEDDSDFMRTLRHLLNTRLPNVETIVREDYVAVMHAITAGGMHMGFRSNPQRANVYLQEIPRVLAAYLSQIEQAHGTDKKRPMRETLK